MKHVFLRALCLLCAVVLLSTFALTGCGSEEPAGEQSATGDDAHAGHNHGDETPSTAPTNQNQEQNSNQKHDHEEPSNMRLAYEEEKGGTFALVIKDCKGNLVLEKKGLAKKALSRQINDYVVCLSWVLNSNPGGYESLYIDRKTCRVSDTIVGEQATDGNRIVCTEIKDGVLNVTVRDLFDKNGYSKTTEVKEAYTKGDYTVLGAVMMKNDQVNISYLTDKDGAHRIKAFDLYEKGEEKPTAAKTTEKTEAKKTDKK